MAVSFSVYFTLTTTARPANMPFGQSQQATPLSERSLQREAENRRRYDRTFPVQVSKRNRKESIMENEIQIIERKVNPIIEQANALTVTTTADVEKGRDAIRVINALVKEVEGTFSPIKRKIDESKKEVLAQERRYLTPLASAKETINNKVGVYLDEQDRIRRAEEAKARAEEERKKAAAIAAADKKIADLMAKSGDLSAQIEALKSELGNPELPDLDRERIGAQLQALQRKYNSLQEKAEEVQAQVETVLSTPAPSLVVNNTPKVAGLSSRTELIPEVTNPLALIKAIGSGQYPAGLVKEWDYALLKKLVNSGMNPPGVSSQSRRVMGVR